MTSTYVPNKGGGCAYATQSAARDIHKILGYKKMILRTDQEPPMIDFKNKLVPLIETSRAIETVTQIAAFKDVVGLFFGAADASASLGCKLAWEPLLYARHRVVLAASMFNLFTIDAPYFYIDKM